MAAPAVRYLESRARVYRHTWRGSVVTTFLNPILFLAAMGLGLGSLVDAGNGQTNLEGLSYLSFLAAGLLAANAMQTGAGDGAYPVMMGIKWMKTYEATLATPMSVAQLVYGHLGWVAIRVAFSSTVFVLVAAAFGAMTLGRGLIAVLPAVLTGVAFAAPATAYTSQLKDAQGLAALFRFGIVPMFLFSGAFFPVSQLPGWIQPVAYATPLWHGVALSRWIALGTEPVLAPLWMIGYLMVWITAGTVLAVRLLGNRMIS
jgi:lipooligosaccharide transport system permease protein